MFKYLGSYASTKRQFESIRLQNNSLPPAALFWSLRAFGCTLLLTGSRCVYGADTEPPSPPQQLTITAKTATSVSLTWSASTDNLGVTGYEVFRDGPLTGTTAGTAYMCSGLTERSYNFRVRARDAAGNVSALSHALLATPHPDGLQHVPHDGDYSARPYRPVLASERSKPEFHHVEYG